MNEKKLIDIFKRPEVQSGLSIVAAGGSIEDPTLGAIIIALKEAISVSDEIKGQCIINGLATGFNQEKYTNQLENYIHANPKNAGYIANTIRNAMLADSLIACTALGRILADHVDHMKTYDQYDVIIIHALVSATDNDLIAFRQMMKVYDSEFIEVTNQDTVDWCVNGRIFKQIVPTLDNGKLSFDPKYKPTTAANILMTYLDEIRQCFRDV